ncbi:MAG: type I methionyl aminopeptidase [Oscillospiraceae bacterium]|jgi:methionyl aminopeptidase|nr:type I methionyl aminopeptidase [Oscillospiraceae bacterium]
MITLKSPREIDLMRRAGRIAAAARALAGGMVAVGVTTGRIDREVREYIVSEGARPAFLGYGGFPKSVCISVNDEVIHGIPGKRALREGDVVSIDVGAEKDGFIGDCAATYIVGEGAEEARKLAEAARESFFEALRFAKAGCRVSDISRAVQAAAEGRGFSVVRDFVGHGVGREMHEPPEIPNYVEEPRRGADPRLLAGMTIAIEPMVNAGAAAVKVLADGWTVVTSDGRLSAHYENTVLITGGAPEILTAHEAM